MKERTREAENEGYSEKERARRKGTFVTEVGNFGDGNRELF